MEFRGRGVVIGLQYSFSIFLAKTFFEIARNADTTLTHDASQSLSSHAFIAYRTRSSIGCSRSTSFNSVRSTRPSSWMAMHFTSLHERSSSALCREATSRRPESESDISAACVMSGWSACAHARVKRNLHIQLCQ